METMQRLPSADRLPPPCALASSLSTRGLEYWENGSLVGDSLGDDLDAVVAELRDAFGTERCGICDEPILAGEPSCYLVIEAWFDERWGHESDGYVVCQDCS